MVKSHISTSRIVLLVAAPTIVAIAVPIDSINLGFVKAVTLRVRQGAIVSVGVNSFKLNGDACCSLRVRMGKQKACAKVWKKAKVKRGASVDQEKDSSFLRDIHRRTLLALRTQDHRLRPPNSVV